MQNEWTERLTALQTLLTVCPADALTRCDLAFLLEESARYDEALSHWKAVLDFDPNNLKAREGMTRCRNRTGPAGSVPDVIETCIHSARRSPPMNRSMSILLLATFLSGNAALAYEEIDGIRGRDAPGYREARGTGSKAERLQPDDASGSDLLRADFRRPGWRLLQPFNVGPTEEFRGVVVYLEGIDKGKAFHRLCEPADRGGDCRFLPFTTVVREKQDVVVVNMDPVMHDIQAYETSSLARVCFSTYRCR